MHLLCIRLWEVVRRMQVNRHQKGKSLSINVILNMFRTFMNMAFPLITYPYVTRVLGVENLGKYNFASSIIGYLTLISAFGISSYAIREGARLRNSREKENVFVNSDVHDWDDYYIIIVCNHDCFMRHEKYRTV